MIEEIKRTFYPEKDEDIFWLREFVKKHDNCITAEIIGNSVVAKFRVPVDIWEFYQSHNLHV